MVVAQAQEAVVSKTIKLLFWLPALSVLWFAAPAPAPAADPAEDPALEWIIVGGQERLIGSIFDTEGDTTVPPLPFKVERIDIEQQRMRIELTSECQPQNSVVLVEHTDEAVEGGICRQLPRLRLCLEPSGSEKTLDAYADWLEKRLQGEELDHIFSLQRAETKAGPGDSGLKPEEYRPWMKAFYAFWFLALAVVFGLRVPRTWKAYKLERQRHLLMHLIFLALLILLSCTAAILAVLSGFPQIGL